MLHLAEKCSLYALEWETQALRLVILPKLGGKIILLLHKPTGSKAADMP